MGDKHIDNETLLRTAVFVDAVDNVKEERLVVVKTDAGEGEYVISNAGADCFATLLKALGYTAEIEELEGATQHGQSDESSAETF